MAGFWVHPADGVFPLSGLAAIGSLWSLFSRRCAALFPITGWVNGKGKSRRRCSADLGKSSILTFSPSPKLLKKPDPSLHSSVCPPGRNPPPPSPAPLSSQMPTASMFASYNKGGEGTAPGGVRLGESGGFRGRRGGLRGRGGRGLGGGGGGEGGGGLGGAVLCVLLFLRLLKLCV